MQALAERIPLLRHLELRGRAGQRLLFHQDHAQRRAGDQRRGGAEHIAERRDHVGGGNRIYRPAMLAGRAKCPRQAPSAGSR